MAVTGPYLCFLPKVVPFGEISVYRSDPRHVAKLTSRSDGLDVVSTARKRRWGEFLAGLEIEAQCFMRLVCATLFDAQSRDNFVNFPF